MAVVGFCSTMEHPLGVDLSISQRTSWVISDAASGNCYALLSVLQHVDSGLLGPPNAANFTVPLNAVSSSFKVGDVTTRCQCHPAPLFHVPAVASYDGPVRRGG